MNEMLTFTKNFFEILGDTTSLFVDETMHYPGNHLEKEMDICLANLLNIRDSMEAVQNKYESISEMSKTVRKKILCSQTVRDIKLLLRHSADVSFNSTGRGFGNYDASCSDAFLARLHFHGNLMARVNSPTNIDNGLFFMEYRKIRSAFRFSDLEDIDYHVKCNTAHALLAYYYDWYLYNLIGWLEGANYPDVPTEYRETRLDKGCNYTRLLKDILVQMTSEIELRESLYNTVPVPKSDALKAQIIAPFCSQKQKKFLIDYLDTLGSSLHIGTVACSKMDFAKVCYILQTTLRDESRVWKMPSFAECQRVMAHYFGVSATQYKPKDFKKGDKFSKAGYEDVDDAIRAFKSIKDEHDILGSSLATLVFNMKKNLR